MTAPSNDLPADLREAVEYAVAAVLWLTKDQQDDLRQDLCVKFLTKAVPDKPKAWAKKTAFNWAKDLARAEDNRRRNENEAAYGKTSCTRRRGDAWQPEWYAPHKDAHEFAPFACNGARVMHCKASGGGSTTNLVDAALAAGVDVRASAGVAHAQRRHDAFEHEQDRRRGRK